MALFRNRAFILLSAGQAVSMVGKQLCQLALPLLVLDLSRSPALTGGFVASRTIPPLVLLLPAGTWLDRWDRKRVMLVSDAARAVALGSIPLTLAWGGPALPWVGVVALVEGAFNTFFTVAQTASLPRVVSDTDLPRALSIDNTSDQVARMVGPTLGGVLYGFGRTVPFIADSISYAASVVSLVFIRIPFQQPRGDAMEPASLGARRRREHHRHDVRERRHWRHRRGFARSETVRRFGVKRTMLVSSWVWVLTWPPFGLAPSLGWLALANALGWLIVPVHGITQLSYRLTSVPNELQARVNSVYRLIAFGDQPLALALSGLLLQRFGPVATVWLITLPQAMLVVGISAGGYLRESH